MSAEKIAFPSLSSFAENNLRLIYEATSERAFNEAFESFFAKHVEITVNGKKLTRANYKQELWREKHNERSATVSFPGVVAVPANKEHPDNAGTVAVFLTALITFIPPHGRPTQERVNASYKLVIEQDKSVEPVFHGERPIGFEIRRVTSLDVVIVEQDASERL